MSTLTEGRHIGDFIMSELPGTLSRDTVIIEVPAAKKLGPGTVLGMLPAGGAFTVYAPYDDAASDGREVASAILIDEVDNSAGVGLGNIEGVVLDFGAEVRADDLVWGDGVDQTAGVADLRAVAIKLRD